MYYLTALLLSLFSLYTGDKVCTKLFTNPNFSLLQAGTKFLDTLAKPDYHCDRFILAETPNKVAELKQTIEKNMAFVLIYKKDTSWQIESDMGQGISIIKKSKIDRIFYCIDNIRISDILYPNVKYAVILE